MPLFYLFCINFLSILFVITPIFGMDKNAEKSSQSAHMEGRYEKTTTNSTASSWTTIYTYPDGSSSKYEGRIKK